MAFYNRINGNYSLMGSRISEEDLLHAVTMPPEIYVAEGGMTSLVEQNRTINHNEEKIEVLNNVLNRIMVSGNVQLTYQDRAYITDVLYKLGIKDDRRFMREVKKFMEETNNTSALIDLYLKRGGDVKSLLEQLEEINKNTVTSTENTYPLNLRTEEELNNFRQYAGNTQLSINTDITKILQEKGENERIREYVETVFGPGFVDTAATGTDATEAVSELRESTSELVLDNRQEPVEKSREVIRESRETEINDFRTEIERVISGQKDARDLIDIYIRRGGDIRTLVQNLQKRSYSPNITEEKRVSEGGTYTESRTENRQYTEESRTEVFNAAPITQEENVNVEELARYAIENVRGDTRENIDNRTIREGGAYLDNRIDGRSYTETATYTGTELEYNYIDESSSVEELRLYASETVGRELKELLLSDRQFLRENTLREDVKESLVRLEEAVAGIAERPAPSETTVSPSVAREGRPSVSPPVRDRRLSQREMMEILSRGRAPSAEEAERLRDVREPRDGSGEEGGRTAGREEREEGETGTAAEAPLPEREIPAIGREPLAETVYSERARDFIKTVEDRLRTEEATEIVDRFASERMSIWSETSEESVYRQWESGVERIFYREDEEPDIEFTREFFEVLREAVPATAEIPEAIKALEPGETPTVNEIDEILPWIRNREVFSYFRTMQRELQRETETRSMRPGQAALDAAAPQRQESRVREIDRERNRDFFRSIENRLNIREA
ncbi:MAG: hypothetical protein J6O55_07015, partial [Lachnospiraceae bacterium]|nr:hypothetical protein [Lachnospiraceae bacterium]